MGMHRTTKSDDYQTPPEALLPLLPYLPRGKTIWEPAMGKGNLVRALHKHGYTVRGTDIKTGPDFLDFNPPHPWEDLTADDVPKPLGEVIVTNPPYTTAIRAAFIEVCYRLNLPFALLMPLTSLEGKQRQSLFRKHGIEVLIPSERYNFEGPLVSGASPSFPVAWFCRNLLPAPLVFANGRKHALSR